MAGRWQSRTGSALAMRFPFRDILFTYVFLYTSTPPLFPSPCLPSALLFLLFWIDFFIPFTHSDPLAALFAAEKRIRSFSETRAGRLTLPLQLVCDSISTYHSPPVFLSGSIWFYSSCSNKRKKIHHRLSIDSVLRTRCTFAAPRAAAAAADSLGYSETSGECSSLAASCQVADNGGGMATELQLIFQSSACACLKNVTSER